MRQQRGGTILGFILGLLVGLGVALGVAVYVMKVPVSFNNRIQVRTPEQDAEEAKKNKDWNPNAPLYGKSPAPTAVASDASAPAAPADNAAAPAAPAPAAAAAPVVAPPAVQPPAAAQRSGPAVADPLGDLVKSKAGAAAGDPFVYWVQVGAFRNQDDAEGLRAKLSLAGTESKVSQRDQSGHTVYRVRVGPFDTRDDGEKAKARLDKAGQQTALVRVAR